MRHGRTAESRRGAVMSSRMSTCSVATTCTHSSAQGEAITQLRTCARLPRSYCFRRSRATLRRERPQREQSRGPTSRKSQAQPSGGHEGGPPWQPALGGRVLLHKRGKPGSRAGNGLRRAHLVALVNLLQQLAQPAGRGWGASGAAAAGRAVTKFLPNWGNGHSRPTKRRRKPYSASAAAPGPPSCC